MRNLLLKSILLVSHREKKAKKIEFDPDITVIKGPNDTGKSSLIKSIYYALGAEPHRLHKRWIDADVAALPKFSIGKDDYSIYRHRRSFSLFDGGDKLIGTYSSVTRELAPELATRLGFKLKLLDREGIPSTPPPAYLFLPFYIDQDRGWVEPWQSFKNLSQYPNWKKNVASYHFGLRPDRWYELDAEKRMEDAKKDIPEREVAALLSLEKRTKQQLARVDFDIDISIFKKEINHLLDQCNLLKNKEEKYRQELVDLRTEKIRLEAQIDIVSRTHDELNADYTFAVDKMGSVIGCPTCGQQYDNSFSERFEIARDAETCMDLLQSLRDDLNALTKKIELLNQSLTSNTKEMDTIRDILSKKQGDVILSDLMKIEGKKELLQHVEAELATQRETLGKIDQRILEISNEMKGFDNREHRNAILDRYSEMLRRYTIKLSVAGLDESVYKSITPTISETGSDQPRAVLAYQFAALDAIENSQKRVFKTLCQLISPHRLMYSSNLPGK